MEADVHRDPSNATVYPCDRSFTQEGGFVRVWNEGTPEFDNDRELCGLVSDIPFRQYLERYVRHDPNDKDKKRGNYQVTFGLAGGQSKQPRTDQNVRAHYGVSVPSVKTGTQEHVPLFRVLTKLCRLLGLRWENTAFVNANPAVRAYLQLLVVLTGFSLGMVTWNAMPIDGEATVAPHVDAENATEVTGLSEVLLVMTVMEHLGM